MGPSTTTCKPLFMKSWPLLICIDGRPREVKDDVVNVAAGGEQNLASLTRVEGAGHLVSHLLPQATTVY